MPNRTRQSGSGRTAGVVAVVSSHPRETLAALTALAAAATIFINALFLQHGPHPAPIFGVSKPAAALASPASRSVVSVAPLRQMGTVPIRSADFEPAAAPQASPTKPAPVMVRNDPIADLITSPKRLTGVQRALAEYGYGPVKATGQFGPETEQAIAKFEREHKMPVTGQMSDRLVRALSAMTGRALD